MITKKQARNRADSLAMWVGRRLTPYPIVLGRRGWKPLVPLSDMVEAVDRIRRSVAKIRAQMEDHMRHMVRP